MAEELEGGQDAAQLLIALYASGMEEKSSVAMWFMTGSSYSCAVSSMRFALFLKGLI